MGCCDNKKCCDDKKTQKRPIPWLGVAVVVLVLLVVVNWH